MLSTPPPRVVDILERSDGGADEVSSASLKREILGRVIAMGLPSMASFLLLTVYDLIDIFWLAKLGEEPVAAVTVFSAFLWVLSFPNNVVGTGSVAVISRRFGSGDVAGTELAIKNTFTAKFAVGTTVGAIGLVVTPSALGFLGAEPLVQTLGVQYGVYQWLALGTALVSFSVYTALRGIGRPALGAWLSVAGAAVNLALDPLLIFGIGPFPELGIRGASIASALGFLTVTVAGCFVLASPKSPIRVHWFSTPGPDWGEMVRMFRIGLPSGIASLSFALSASIVVKLVAIYGTSVVALFGMSQKALRFGIMLIAGLGLGTSALVGQYLGGRQLDRAWLAAVISIQLATATMILFGLCVFVFAPQIVRTFFSDPALLEPGTLYLRVLTLGLPFVGISLGAENAYAGAGKNTPTMIATISTSWGFTIPLMYVLGEVVGWGPPGMMMGSSLGHLAGAIVGVWLVRRGTWLEHAI